MTALSMAKMAYATGAETLAPPRSTEYEAFSKVTQRLIAAARLGRRGFVHVAHAVHTNRKLWTVLAAGVADNDNALPPELRARVFYLAEFTERHSRLVLRGKADIGPLVDVNTAIMRGLGDETP